MKFSVLPVPVIRDQRDQNAVFPPIGTAPATRHVLSAEGHMLTDPRIEFFAVWNGSMWETKGCSAISPAKAFRCGFLYERELPLAH
jgi:hypothetical protein